jgi:hypothetical protein
MLSRRFQSAFNLLAAARFVGKNALNCARKISRCGRDEPGVFV